MKGEYYIVCVVFCVVCIIFIEIYLKLYLNQLRGFHIDLLCDLVFFTAISAVSFIVYYTLNIDKSFNQLTLSMQ